MWNRNVRVVQLLLLLVVVAGHLGVTDSLTGTGIPTAGTGVGGGTGTSPPTQSHVLSHKKVVVVGGGPVGLYFAALLLQQDPTVRIEILEQRTERSVNAFGLGISTRMQHRLAAVAGLKEQLLESTVELPSLGIPMISRDDLSEQMKVFLEERQPTTACKMRYGTSCASVDFDQKHITTHDGTIIKYDLLVAADGVNSKIRQQLVTERGFHEERYLQDLRWKALSLPKQPDTSLAAGSFKPLQHPSLASGRVLPKAPEGHTVLLLWKDHTQNNPEGVDTKEELKTMMIDALQDKNRKLNLVRKLAGLGQSDDVNKDRTVVFDEVALQSCVEARAGRVQYLRLPQYHYDDSVALIGDSAHAFNSLLGQGCATGLDSTHTLVDALLVHNTLKAALASYSNRATVEAHAITELSLLSYALSGGKRMSFKAFPLLILNILRGKSLIKRLGDITVPYSQIAKENATLLKVCRREFEKKRIQY